MVRECSCSDPNSCSQACGSEMVDRLYIEAAVTDEMVERAAEAYEFGVMPGDESEATMDEKRAMARRVLAAALHWKEEQ